MSGIELASLFWSLPGMVIPITVAYFSCADESQLRSVHDDVNDFDATMLRMPEARRARATTTAEATYTRRSTIQTRVHELDIGVFRLDGSDDEQEREGVTSTTNVINDFRVNHPTYR